MRQSSADEGRKKLIATCVLIVVIFILIDFPLIAVMRNFTTFDKHWRAIIEFAISGPASILLGRKLYGLIERRNAAKSDRHPGDLRGSPTKRSDG